MKGKKSKKKGKSAAKASPKAHQKKRTKQTGKLSMLDAAEQLLKSARKPLRCQELITKMGEQNLWSSPGGKTPHATLYAAFLREINERGKESRFRKVERGLFEYAL